MFWGGTNSLMPGFSVQVLAQTSMDSPNNLQYLVDDPSKLIFMVEKTKNLFYQFGRAISRNIFNV